MLSAFKLHNNRLSRLELDESDDLASSLWVDLVEPEEGERERVQTELGQSLATRPELDDIEASARFLKMKMVCTFTPSSITKMLMIMRVTRPWHLLFVMVAFTPCVSVNCRRFVCTVCAHVTKR